MGNLYCKNCGSCVEDVPKGQIRTWWVLLCEDILGKPFTFILNKKFTIKKFGKKIYEEFEQISFPSENRGESLDTPDLGILDESFFDCFKKKYRHLVSCQYDNGEMYTG